MVSNKNSLIKSCVYQEKYLFLPKIALIMSNIKHSMNLNRLKVVLVEQNKTSRWLAEQLDKSENTVSRWCRNEVQPSLSQLNIIAKLLNVDVRTLVCSNFDED